MPSTAIFFVCESSSRICSVLVRILSRQFMVSHRFTQMDADTKRCQKPDREGGQLSQLSIKCLAIVALAYARASDTLQKFTPTAAIIASTTAMIASPQINPDA